MPKEPIKILAINPGSRYIGMAFFQGSELRDWGIKVVKGRWSKDKMKKIRLIVSDFIERYGPNVLAIKRLHPSRGSERLKQLVRRIKGLAKRKGLEVYQYSIKELEAFFSPDVRINKKQMAEIVASEYPALFHELERERSHRNPYYIRMFEAVALGSMCFRHLDRF